MYIDIRTDAVRYHPFVGPSAVTTPCRLAPLRMGCSDPTTYRGVRALEEMASRPNTAEQDWDQAIHWVPVTLTNFRMRYPFYPVHCRIPDFMSSFGCPDLDKDI